MLATQPNQIRAGHRLGGLGSHLCEDSKNLCGLDRELSGGHTELCLGPVKEHFNVSMGLYDALACATGAGW